MALRTGQMVAVIGCPGVDQAFNSPVRPGYGHVSLDNTINANPLVFRGVSLEGDTRMPANKAAPTIRTDEVLATSGVSKRHNVCSRLDAPFELECPIRPLVSESRSDSMRIRTGIIVDIEIDTLHSLEIYRSNLFEFLTEDCLGVHLSQHKSKVIIGVANILHERPDSAG
jgi:hypothetical protein